MRLRLFRAAGAFAIALLAPLLAQAQEKADVNAAAELAGCETATSAAVPVRLSITCDVGKVVANVPQLQQLGVLNPDFDQTYWNLHQVTLTGLISMFVAAVAIPSAYQTDEHLDVLLVTAFVVTANDYGQTESHEAFAFRFDRALDSRINWDKFQFSKFPKVSKGFAISPWYGAAVAREDN